jgi:hypothetical protein
VSFFFISILFSILSLHSFLQAPSPSPLPLLTLLHSLLSLSHSLLALSASAASHLYPSHLCALLLLALACLTLSHLATNHPLLASLEYLTSEFFPGQQDARWAVLSLEILSGTLVSAGVVQVWLVGKGRYLSGIICGAV